MFVAALRARRRSLCGASRMFWSFVYEWIVDMKPLTQPRLSTIGFTAVARQFVVHDAFEMMLCFAGSYIASLTPSTSVMSSPLAGAEMMTFFAPPPSMCARALAASVKRPVDSMTMSTPRSRHGSLPGSRSARTLIVLPSIVIAVGRRR